MTRAEYLRRCERDYWERLMERHGGNVSAAVKEAGVYRSTFYKWAKVLSVKRRVRYVRHDGNAAWQSLEQEIR